MRAGVWRSGLQLAIGVALCSCSIDQRSPDSVPASSTQAVEPSAAATTPSPASGSASRDVVAADTGAAKAANAAASLPSGSAAGAAGASGCTEAARRCVQGAPEVCRGGAWVPGSPCADPLGVCLESTGICVSCEPGSKRCNASRVEGCDDTGAWQSLGMSCIECVPDVTDCLGSTARVCSAQGAWVGQNCTGHLPVCVATTGTCACTPTSCAEREVCAASGSCEALGPDCPEPGPMGVADQDLAIIQVRFVPDGSADVLLEHLGGGLLNYAAHAYQLCNGRNDCVYLSLDTSLTLVGDQKTFSLQIPNTVASGGELAVVLFNDDGTISSDAYVAWGSGAGTDSLESSVDGDLRLWVTGERISIPDGETGFVCVGDTSRGSGYSACHP